MIDIWHNPRCSKSRQALALLKDTGQEILERRYLDDVPTRDELIQMRAALGQIPVIDMMRPGERRFKELGLNKADPDETLLQAMVDNPILIERPIVRVASHAVIGRPPERVLDLLR